MDYEVHRMKGKAIMLHLGRPCVPCVRKCIGAMELLTFLLFHRIVLEQSHITKLFKIMLWYERKQYNWMKKPTTKGLIRFLDGIWNELIRKSKRKQFHAQHNECTVSMQNDSKIAQLSCCFGTERPILQQIAASPSTMTFSLRTHTLYSIFLFLETLDLTLKGPVKIICDRSSWCTCCLSTI